MSKTYLEMLKGDDEQDQKELMFVAKDALHNLNGDINETEKAINKAEQDLFKAKRAIPYSPYNEIECSEILKGFKEGLIFLNKIKDERFSDIK